MKETYAFRYGQTTCPITVQATDLTVLTATPPPPIDNVKIAFLESIIKDMVSSPRLADCLHDDDRITILISDITRAWSHQDRIIPLLVDYLHDSVGIAHQDIIIVVAVGTHRFQTEAEMRTLVTDRIFDLVKVCNHDAYSDLVAVGTTTRGTQVKVNPLVVNRKVILIGSTIHHMFAGYGGGRKSILPGVSGEETIAQNHGNALDPHQKQTDIRVGCGKLENNPVNEDMLEACDMVAPIFGINLVANQMGQHVAIVSGDPRKAWKKSCEIVNEANGVAISEKADTVVVSCGGYPNDIDLYQVAKTMMNAYLAVKKGGNVILLAQCPEGGGPASFFDWSKYLSTDTLDEELRKHFTIAGYIFYACCEMSQYCHFHMLSQIDPEAVRPMNITAHASMETLLPLLNCEGQKVYVMPDGSFTVPLFS